MERQERMRKILPEKLEAGRVVTGPMRSDRSWGPFGKFMLNGPCGARLMVVANGAEPESFQWEHVSVSLSNRCPNWPEMCFVKDLFWNDDETVLEIHPEKSVYISNHPNCLHLWRDALGDPRLPPPELVGIVGRGEMSNLELLKAYLENERRR